MPCKRISYAARTRTRPARGGPLFNRTPDRRTRRVTAPLSASWRAVLSLGLLAAMAGAVLSGCTRPGQLAEGPLGKVPENHVVAGQPVRQGMADTIGLDATYNGGPAPAVIDLFYHVGSAYYEWRGHVRIVLTLVRRTS